jgi:hypothetical protein
MQEQLLSFDRIPQKTRVDRSKPLGEHYCKKSTPKFYQEVGERLLLDYRSELYGRVARL